MDLLKGSMYCRCTMFEIIIVGKCAMKMWTQRLVRRIDSSMSNCLRFIDFPTSHTGSLPNHRHWEIPAELVIQDTDPLKYSFTQYKFIKIIITLLCRLVKSIKWPRHSVDRSINPRNFTHKLWENQLKNRKTKGKETGDRCFTPTCTNWNQNLTFLR